MTKKLAFTSVCIALAVVFLVLSAILPTAKLVFFFVSTIVMVLVVMVAGVKYATAAYCATTILSFIFIPGNLNIIAFALFFGYYPIAKLYIEKIRNLFAEWIIKLVLFNIVLLILPLIIPSIPWYAFVVADIAFVLYDLLVSYMISYITNRFSKVLNQFI